MNYPMLQKLKNSLETKKRNNEEEKLFTEIKIILDELNNKSNYSLSTSSGKCPTCGQTYSKLN